MPKQHVNEPLQSNQVHQPSHDSLAMAIAVAMGITIIVTAHAQPICLANNRKEHFGIDACVLSDSFVLVQNGIDSNSEQVDMVRGLTNKNMPTSTCGHNVPN